MPAMASDWPRGDPRAFSSPQPSDPHAAMRSLPSVAELLSSRPPAHHPAHASSTYHRQDSTTLSIAPAATSANVAPPSYWIPVNHRPTSPPVSPTEQRPLPMSTSSSTAPSLTSTSAAGRVYPEAHLCCQQVSKLDTAIHQSALSSGLHNAPYSSTTQARQDSAIDHNAQPSKPNVAFSHQSPKDGQPQPTTRLDAYYAAASTSACALTHVPTSVSAPSSHHDEAPPTEAGVHLPPHQHATSLSLGVAYLAASPRSHEHTTEQTIPADVRNGSDSRLNNSGSTSLPEPSYGQQVGNGTRQQRYNVRFAANYTSENMQPSQRSRNDPPIPNAAPVIVTEPEQHRSSPPLVSTTEEHLPNGNTHVPEPHPRTTKDTRDREPTVERCPGCNEAWRRPIPDMDSPHLLPAETNEEYGRIASNMIERLRRQNKMADAAYDDWKWRHSRCTHRHTSPFSTASAEDIPRRTEPVDASSNGTTDRKRKSENPHEPPSASKQQRVTNTSPAPPVRQLESS